MSVTLSKGGNVSLTKEAPGLKVVRVGLGWNPQRGGGRDYDLDASAFLLTADGKVRNNDDVVWYGNLQSGDKSVVHSGDNLTGQGDGDDEVITADLEKVPAEIQKLVFIVDIYQAKKRGQSFSQVDDAFIRIFLPDGKELARYSLNEKMGEETAMIFGEIYRHNGEWKFRAIGQGSQEGLEEFKTQYGATGKRSLFGRR